MSKIKLNKVGDIYYFGCSDIKELGSYIEEVKDLAKDCQVTADEILDLIITTKNKENNELK